MERQPQTMTDRRPTSSWAGDLPQSQLAADQVLSRVVDLVRDSSTVTDFHQDRLEATLEVPLRATSADQVGYSARLTTDWSYSIRLKQDSYSGRFLEFRFVDNDGMTAQSMSEICEMDFAQVSTRLESAGFARETTYGEHGQVIHDSYQRDDLHITILTRGESQDN